MKLTVNITVYNVTAGKFKKKPKTHHLMALTPYDVDVK